MKRHEKNPVITPSMLKPTLPELEVIGAFNAGATLFGDETILLLRVAERCKAEDGFVAVPVYSFSSGASRPDVLRFRIDDPEVELHDTRGVTCKGVSYLTTLSTIRVARSRDGIEFTVEDDPFLCPCVPYEQYGCEDARVQMIDGVYYVNYTGVSRDGWVAALCTTEDFGSVDRKGVIFPPPNKDVCIFPEKIAGMYRALHRPHNEGFGKPSIWISSSPDMINWGGHQCILRPRDSRFERVKIGGGAPPIKTDKGWLELYHGRGQENVYSLFTLLLDLNDPTKVLARGKKPFLTPEKEYETNGFFPNVVFSNGWVRRDNDDIYVYYGASDETTNLAVTSIDDMLTDLGG